MWPKYLQPENLGEGQMYSLFSCFCGFRLSKLIKAPGRQRRDWLLSDSHTCPSLSPGTPCRLTGICNLIVCQGNRKTVALSLGMQVTLNALSEEKGAFITFIGIDKRTLSTNTFSEYLGWGHT